MQIAKEICGDSGFADNRFSKTSSQHTKKIQTSRSKVKQSPLHLGGYKEDPWEPGETVTFLYCMSQSRELSRNLCLSRFNLPWLHFSVTEGHDWWRGHGSLYPVHTRQVWSRVPGSRGSSFHREKLVCLHNSLRLDHLCPPFSYWYTLKTKGGKYVPHSWPHSHLNPGSTYLVWADIIREGPDQVVTGWSPTHS